MDRLRKHIEEIVTVTDDEFEYIQSFFTLKRTRKNQFLIHEGDEVRYEFLVLSGLFKVYYLDSHNKEYILHFAQKNWWMADYVGYFKQEKATVFVECIEAGEVLFTTLQSREKLASESQKMSHFFRVKLTNGYVALQERIKLLLSSSPLERYETFSKLYPDLLQQLPKKLIAQFLGVSRETLSRLYSK